MIFSITAPRLWDDLPPELQTISLPLPPSLPITTHPPPLSVDPRGLSLKIKMSFLQTLLPRPIHLFYLNETHLNSYSVGVCPLLVFWKSDLSFSWPLWKHPFDSSQRS